ncbi:restriction endonuclease [Clostridium beijerinckii]|uniref:Restriction endonuclease type IV Mrr domain-containing protein n=1 Tax=Clostridium beijerinckii TaxID=1520 RepID=A0AAX0B0Y8_CLOBE|nr:restriction endonuclease [Clostridium beijerinckii]NRT88861.1 hypothetical protein [Clostridium beijerinckii]NYC74316.1 hypothetical protein [Clostridium beijerinckii]
MSQKISKNNIKNIAKYIFYNCKYENIEILEYLIIEIYSISKMCNLEVELIENYLIDRMSVYYKELIDILKHIISSNNIKSCIYILDEAPFFYVCINVDYVQDLLDKSYYKKLECILKNKNDSEKGYYYQDLVLIFMEDFKIQCMHRGKSNDGGIDLIGNEKNTILDGYLELIINLYGQIKCYMYEVKPFEIKQFIKDCIYRSIENGEVLYNLSKKLFFINHKGFTDAAKEFCNIHNIIFLDSEDLIRIAINNKASNFLFEIDNEYRKLNGNSINKQ